jgi:hypothetical protein
MQVEIDTVLEFLRDISQKRRIDQLFDLGHNVEEYDYDNMVVYQKYKRQFIVSARDFVIFQSLLRNHTDGKTYAVAFSVDYPGIGPQCNTVRGTLHMAAYVFEPIDSVNVKVTYLINAEFGGRLPGWAIKMVNKKQPKVLSKLKKLMHASRK